MATVTCRGCALARRVGRLSAMGSGYLQIHVGPKRAMSSGTEQPFDVVVVGAGVVGAALACKLAESPHLQSSRIAVIEAKPPAPVACITAESEPDLRTFAITPASKRLFEACGVWDRMCAVRAPAFGSMQVWDALGPGYLRFHASEAGAAELGWIVELAVLQGALYEKLQEHASKGRISLECPASIKSIQFPGAGAEPAVPGAAKLGVIGGASMPSPHALSKLELADGRSIQARLVVGADGAMSRVRDAAKIGVWGWEYDQRAVVATVNVAPGHERTAWQRFLPNGPVAILPLWDNLASIVWSTTPAHAEALVKATPTAFVDALNTVLTAPTDAFQRAVRGESDTPIQEPQVEYPAQSSTASPQDGAGGQGRSGATSASDEALYDRARDTLWLDPLSVSAKLLRGAADRAARAAQAVEPFHPAPSITGVLGIRASFPLKLTKANAYVGPRVALVGDSAHTVHPLAGQGLNLGLGDVSELANVLSQAAYAGSDLGSVGVLRAYERQRSAQNLLMMAAMDGIKRAFSAGTAGPLEEPWAAARSLGMALINGSRPLKARIAHVAMGGQ